MKTQSPRGEGFMRAGGFGTSPDSYCRKNTREDAGNWRSVSSGAGEVKGCFVHTREKHFLKTDDGQL